MSVIEFTAAAARRREGRPTTWVRVTSDVRVAYFRGMFGGMVVQHDGVFTAYDLFGRDRGAFTTVSEAKRDVEGLLTHPSVLGWLDDVAPADTPLTSPQPMDGHPPVPVSAHRAVGAGEPHAGSGPR